jgi:putative DNA primase/helicase
VALYLAGERWWPGEAEGHLFRDEQERRFQADAWEDVIREHLAGSTMETYTVAEVAKDCLRMDPHQLKPPEEQRIGRVMSRLGWPKTRPRVLRGNVKLRLWVFSRPKQWLDQDDQ